MHVLRIYLTAGQTVELLYRGKGDVRSAMHRLESNDPDVKLSDDFGKEMVVGTSQVAGWQSSDYEAELAGALEVAWAKQQANERHGQRVAAQHGLIGRGMPGMPANGAGIVMG